MPFSGPWTPALSNFMLCALLTYFGQVYWGLDLPQSVMSGCSVGLDDLASGNCAHTMNRHRYKPVPVLGTRTCGNRLAWCYNGRLVSKYSCLNGRLIFTISIQTVEFVSGRIVAVELANDSLPAKRTTFPFSFSMPTHMPESCTPTLLFYTFPNPG